MVKFNLLYLLLIFTLNGCSQKTDKREDIYKTYLSIAHINGSDKAENFIITKNDTILYFKYQDNKYPIVTVEDYTLQVFRDSFRIGKYFFTTKDYYIIDSFTENDSFQFDSLILDCHNDLRVLDQINIFNKNEYLFFSYRDKKNINYYIHKEQINHFSSIIINRLLFLHYKKNNHKENNKCYDCTKINLRLFKINKLYYETNFYSHGNNMPYLQILYNLLYPDIQ